MMNWAGRGTDAGSGSRKRGIFLTFDMAISLLVMFTVISIAAYYATLPPSTVFSSQLTRNYLRDAASIMSQQGYFAKPLETANDSDTAGLRSVMRSLPSSICMEVDAYGIVAPGSLSGYWKMDENGGYSVADYSGNGLAGSLLGQPNSTEGGRAGRALSFKGVDDAVNVSDAPELNPYNESFSISAWINTSSGGTVVSKLPSAGYPGYRLFIVGGRAASCFYSISSTCNDGGGAVLSNSALTDSGWHHVAAVFDRYTGNATMYVDGTLQSSMVTGFGSAGSINSTQSMYIGSNYSSGSSSTGFAGQIDEVRFYKKALAQTDVNALYSNSRNLLYAINRGNCSMGNSGEVQALEVPFVYNVNQDSNGYGVAVIRAWQRGSR